jgi:hypothetical protein
MKQIIGIINFNTLCKKNSSSFISSRESEWENHKANILDKRNIDFRLNILINHSLPNLLNYIPQDVCFNIVILYSSLLDDDTQQTLHDYAHKFNEIILESRSEEDYLDINGSIKRVLSSIPIQRDKVIFGSFRLDDDDILSNQYLSELSNYVVLENLNKFITFSNGIECLWKNNNIDKLCFCNKQFIAIGLSHIGLFDNKSFQFLTEPQTVYCGISHFDIPKKFEYIIDDTPNMFIYSRHNLQDTSTKYKFWNKNVINNLDKNIIENFPTINY